MVQASAQVKAGAPRRAAGWANTLRRGSQTGVDDLDLGLLDAVLLVALGIWRGLRAPHDKTPAPVLASKPPRSLKAA